MGEMKNWESNSKTFGGVCWMPGGCNGLANHLLNGRLFAPHWTTNRCLLRSASFMHLAWQDLNKKAKRIWMAAIFCGIASEGFKYRAACDNDDESGKTKSCFNTLAHVGDMAVPLVIGFDFPLSDGVVGLGRMIAASVQSYNIFQGTKSKPKEKETDPSSPKAK